MCFGRGDMAAEETVKDMNAKEDGSLKRKEVDNVPRGMGWGAQSVAAARISRIREKDPESVNDFGRFVFLFFLIFDLQE